MRVVHELNDLRDWADPEQLYLITWNMFEVGENNYE